MPNSITTFAASVLLLAGLAAGCTPTNRRCVSSSTTYMPTMICSSWGKYGCRGYTTITTPVSVCTRWACNPGYVERNGKCVSAGTTAERAGPARAHANTHRVEARPAIGENLAPYRERDTIDAYLEYLAEFPGDPPADLALAKRRLWEICRFYDFDPDGCEGVSQPEPED